MSAPDELLSDRAADSLEVEAAAMLDAAPLLPSKMTTLAAATLALAADRRARIALATEGGAGQ